MDITTAFLILFLIIIFIVSFVILRKTATKRDRMIPKLSICVEYGDDDLCAIKMTNKGEGTAVIKEINFMDRANSDTEKKSIDQVFPFSKSYWVHNTNFTSGKEFYLASGDSLYFGKLQRNRILKNGGNYNKTKSKFYELVNDIKIQVKYNDILDVPQTPFIFNN